VSWWLVAWLSLGAYAFKVLGFVVVGSRKLPELVTRCLLLIPAALLAALVVKDAATTGQQLVLDERMLGLGVAAVAAWRRVPLIAVVVLAAGTTALLRAVTG
jgi:branched-subunit amino acid transport protein